MSINIVPVRTRKQLKEFVRFPWKIYSGNPYWVPPIIRDKMNFLDKKKGVFFEFGEAEYYLAYKNGELSGRIDAHVDHQYERYHDDETGFFGFFECIEDQEVSDSLFQAAEGWIRDKKKTRLLGPECFTIYDETAMLYEGYDSFPTILLPYNPPYYHELVENCGYSKAIDWYAFWAPNDVKPADALFKVRERVLKRNNIRIVPLDMKEYEKRVEEVKVIFRDAWMDNWGHTPLTDRQFGLLAKELKLVLKSELTYFAEVDGKTVGVIITILDANEALKRANGRLFPFGLFKILLALKRCKRLRVLIMGVMEEYRNRGLDIVFYLETMDNGRTLGFQGADCSLIVETNERMIRAVEEFGARRYKTYRLYEKDITKTT